MHPNRAFSITDHATLRQLARSIGFGTLFAVTPDGPRVAHAPFLFLSEGSIGFHLAKGNALVASLEATEALFVVNGPGNYVSPDWYGIDNQVPTWNYIALEMQGRSARMDSDRLIALLDGLSAEHEARLAPKRPWTRSKMDESAFNALLRGIVGFEMEITEWRGTAKLSQNKPEIARAGVAAALTASGRSELARLVESPPQ